MAIGRVNTGGGGLNFKVVGGTAQPTGSENLIWVNTDAPISEWEFAPNQPTAAEGKVWFKTANISGVPLNAVKKNGLWVYPNSCRQYVGGAWVDKIAMVYQLGTWVEWQLYLYVYGNECNVLTGTWNGTLSFDGYTMSQAAREADRIHGEISNKRLANCYATPANSIDVTDISLLKFSGNVASASGSGGLALRLRTIRTGTYGSNIVATAAPTTIGAFEKSVDVSALTGSYILTIEFTATANVGSVAGDVYEVWGETL